MTATTALTAQNTLGVEDVHITPPAFVGKQIRKVMEDGFMEGQAGVIKMGKPLRPDVYGTANGLSHRHARLR
jgi:hydroxymethylpyrimidine/phosphomethylpyrimidine kinase